MRYCCKQAVQRKEDKKKKELNDVLKNVIRVLAAVFYWLGNIGLFIILVLAFFKEANNPVLAGALVVQMMNVTIFSHHYIQQWVKIEEKKGKRR